MGPLDLRQRAPRSSREALDGIVFLPRTIDKARAMLPGGDLGGYLLTVDGLRTLSGLLFRRLGIDREAFVESVAAAPDDRAVADWVRARVDQGRIDAWNALVTGIRIRDLDDETLARVRRLHPSVRGVTADDALLDVLDAEDRTALPQPPIL